MDQADQKELIQLLKENNTYLKQQNEIQQKQIQDLTQTIANLNETVEYLKNKIFGASSEKLKVVDEVSPDQLSLFNEVEACVDPSVEEPSVETVLGGANKKKRQKKRTREDLLKNLPIVEVLVQLADEDKYCSFCNTEMKVLGKKFVREELRITPAVVERIHYIQETMICPQCKADDEPVIKAAQVPRPLMKHSLASPSTVAHVMYQKYVNSMPLYRQSKDWQQMGVELPRATLANWVNTCGMDYMRPIYDHLHKLLLEREVINADELCYALHNSSYVKLYLM